MQYGKQLIQSLNSVPERPCQETELAVGDNSLELRASIREAGKFGCQVDQIMLREKHPNGTSLDVRAAGEQLAERATYLPENLRLIECDEELSRSLLRSAEVNRDGDDVSYFEGEIGAHAITFTRYKTRRHSHTRDSVPFVLTRDTLARFVDDIARAARASD